MMEREIKALIRIIALAATNDTAEAEKAVEWAYNGQEKPKRAKPQPKVDNTAAIERIYNLYPASTIRPDGGKATLRSIKDKEKIERLLAVWGEERLTNTIKRYLKETDPKFYKMFQTLLNNLPDYHTDNSPKPEPTKPNKDQYDFFSDPELVAIYNAKRKQ